MSTGIHTIGQERVVSVRHRSVTYTEAAGGDQFRKKFLN